MLILNENQLPHRNNVKGWYNLSFTPSFETTMFRNICWAQRLFILMIFYLFVLSLSSMLSGCGNKGDLYLPDTGSIDKGSINDSKTNKAKKKS